MRAIGDTLSLFATDRQLPWNPIRGLAGSGAGVIS